MRIRIVCAIVLLLMCGCSAKETSTMTFGVVNSIDIVPIALANELGYFAAEGITVNLQPFASAKERDAAMQANQLDGIICDTIGLAIFRGAGVDLRITGASTGEWSLMANTNDLAALCRGGYYPPAFLGISENTLIDYIAYMTERDFGVTFTRTPIPSMPARLDSLRNAQIDAAILPAPYSYIAADDGFYEIAKYTNDTAMLSAICFTQAYIESNQGAVDSFYKAYDKAVAELNANSSKHEDEIKKASGYPDDIPLTLPTFYPSFQPSVELVQQAFDWAYGKGIISAPLAADEAFQ